MEILVYRLMINVRLFNEFSFKIYGSFKGGYVNNLKKSDTDSLTEPSVYGNPTKSGSGSEYGHSHFGKHTHKKRSSNK